MQRWKTLVTSDDALRAAIDPSRGVWDIGSIDAFVPEEDEDEDEGEDEGEDGDEDEDEWARLACTLADVRDLVDSVASNDQPKRFECTDAESSCVLHGDHDTATVRIRFKGGKLHAFTRLDSAGRSDDSVEQLYKWVTEQEAKLATRRCSASMKAKVAPPRARAAAESLRLAVRTKKFKGVVSHLIAPKKRIKLSFGITEGSHGAVEFIETQGATYFVGIKAFTQAMRTLQTGDMPVIQIGKTPRCSSNRESHYCHFGYEGFGYDADTGPDARSVFAVEFGSAPDGTLFIRELQIRTET